MPPGLTSLWPPDAPSGRDGERDSDLSRRLLGGKSGLEVRAITDGADHAAAAEFEANLERSMPNLAQTLLTWGPLSAPGLPNRRPLEGRTDERADAQPHPRLRRLGQRHDIACLSNEPNAAAVRPDPHSQFVVASPATRVPCSQPVGYEHKGSVLRGPFTLEASDSTATERLPSRSSATPERGTTRAERLGAEVLSVQIGGPQPLAGEPQVGPGPWPPSP